MERPGGALGAARLRSGPSPPAPLRRRTRAVPHGHIQYLAPRHAVTWLGPRPLGSGQGSSPGPLTVLKRSHRLRQLLRRRVHAPGDKRIPLPHQSTGEPGQ
ncbi:hypothetical protein AAFF_G00211570 [Aldrovandia affinis]|uniref:Uncharacterized protein n=1 Tax=Aldrovandia affinis TaxID=143900 RepID=A0AAD7SWN8_9TELE|nr:hypothetical protein AAFF_G00211570 [Aldrovandia affinis]